MLEGITRGLSDALKKLRGRSRLSADNIREGLREVPAQVSRSGLELAVQRVRNVADLNHLRHVTSMRAGGSHVNPGFGRRLDSRLFRSPSGYCGILITETVLSLKFVTYA